MIRLLRAHALSLPGAWRPERANQWTHALGLILSLAAGVVMLGVVWNSPDAGRLWGCAVYVGAMIALYAASTLSHSFEVGPYREFYRMLDQVCIFVFIAACFTPFALTHLRSGFGVTLLVAMWLLALAGVVVRIRSRSETFPIALFLPLGWLPILAVPRIYEVANWQGLLLVLIGGMFYTGGFWFLANDHKRGWYHPAWHVSTIAGTAFHYLFLLEFVARSSDFASTLATHESVRQVIRTGAGSSQETLTDLTVRWPGDVRHGLAHAVAESGRLRHGRQYDDFRDRIHFTA